MRTLIEITKSTQNLLAHFLSSLSPPKTPSKTNQNSVQTSSSSSALPNPLETLKSTTTLLKSHTTTLSLLLLTPPLTPSAIITKLSDVSTSVLSGMVASASAPAPPPGETDTLGNATRGDLRAQVRRLLGTWGDVLALVVKLAQRREGVKGKDTGPTEAERQEVLAATGVVWEACDGLLKTCRDGVVGVVVRKAEELRGTLIDAVEELKEWGEDIEDDDDKGETSEDEDEDELFGAENKLGKEDKELKKLLDTSVKKLKMVGMLYQALIKRRLKSFPTPTLATNSETSETTQSPMARLDQLMDVLKTIPDTVDDLASAFYDLDEDEATETLQTCLNHAKSAAQLVQQNWQGKDDEFTTWSGKWISALEA
ncbi:hypothetical protein B0J11DRAFT_546580 [Dendryphion nanum]|uniref:Cyclin-D1-binding protein 1-like N-terminal domain-containing protein n=1 Tax=Dendryphion nanum TaxID=256645 RepID=A0A9P9IYY7_9PLEO|nr:hypothetical protein B0J11DRAFT_546580 [Dendryphion nanum]